MMLSDVYANTLSELSAIRLKMLSPEWQDALDGATRDQRVAASHELVKVQQAILTLSDASLGAIAGQMQAQTAALQAATVAVNQTFAEVTRVSDVLDAVAAMIGVVGRVVPLV